MSLELQIVELSKKRADIINGAGAILTKAHTENRNLNTEEQSEFDRRHKEGADLRAQIERMQTQLAEDRALASAMPDTRQAGRGDVTGSDPETAKAEIENQDFRSFVRGGLSGMEPERRARVTKRMMEVPNEVRALAEGTGTAGGYTVPTGFEKDLVLATLAIGKYLKFIDSITTELGNSLPWPSGNDTGQSATIVGENAVVASTGADPLFGQTTFGAYMYTSNIVLVPLTLMNDSAFNVEGYLQKMFAIRFARALNAHFTTGTGTNQPTGVVTTATNSGYTTATNATLAFTDLVNVFHALDPSYRDEARFMFHDSTLQTIQKLTDSNGRPLFSPGGVTSDLSKPVADTILGRPYIINQGMPQIGSLAKSVLFGDFSNYKHRAVKGTQMLRLVERYADFLQVGFMAWQRHDGKLIDAGTHPVVYLAQPV